MPQNIFLPTCHGAWHAAFREPLLWWEGTPPCYYYSLSLALCFSVCRIIFLQDSWYQGVEIEKESIVPPKRGSKHGFRNSIANRIYCKHKLSVLIPQLITLPFDCFLADIDDLKICYVLRERANATSDLFHFTVEDDGKHSTLWVVKSGGLSISIYLFACFGCSRATLLQGIFSRCYCVLICFNAE